MDKQPEALRLADRCANLATIADAYSDEAYREAAAELRRQHALIAELVEALSDLLEAADSMAATYGCIYGRHHEEDDTPTHEQWAERFLLQRADEARAALSKAKEQ